MGENVTMPKVGSVKSCVKCGKLAVCTDTGPAFTRSYDDATNTVVSVCMCGYTWRERCADGSEPKPACLALPTCLACGWQ